MKKRTEIKKLKKAYTKRLKYHFDNDMAFCIANLDYFVEQLRYLRDYFTITEDLVINDAANLKIASIATAIKEYELYHTCDTNYFQVSPTGLVLKTEGTYEEVMQKYLKEKQLHYRKFFLIVMDNLEVWGSLNAAF